VPPPERTLLVCFDSADAFREEYESNLANGGVFVATDEPFELREAVRVELRLAWTSESASLRGEVVHLVPSQMASVGGTPGVAVQFTESAAAIRERLDPLARTSPARAPVGDKGKRGARRTPARVPARIAGGHDVVDGHTRNLSHTGALVAVRGDAVPIGQRVRLTLEHPTTGEERDLEGEVVRQVESGGRVSALAIRFDAPPEGEREAVEQFLSGIQSAESTRRLGGISGPIEELGPQSLVQMFATTAPRGTLYLRSGEEEGLVGFESGLMRFARLGSATGLKALVRMLSWQDGTFEFHARLDEVDTPEPPFPLEAAVLEAVRQIDEGARVDGARFPLHARLAVPQGADVGSYGPLSKVEEAVLDLARAGFSVQRALDVIPEPDPEIFRALQSLGDCGLVSLRREGGSGGRR
jgi:Tfp pilus assembly protein PilZ